MTENHPITPPPELVQQWTREYDRMDPRPNIEPFIATQAARWGADYELEACCEWIADWYGHGCNEVIGNLRTSRRPKPPSLKEQALAALNEIEDRHAGPTIQEELIRRALEALPDD